MKRFQTQIRKLESNRKLTIPDENPQFIENLQSAVLLALLERKQLTEWQVERCLEELNKTIKR